MDPARIAELLEPFLGPPATASHCHSEPGQRTGEACSERSRREPAVLSAVQLQSISTYIDLLLRWNARVNLTAVRDPEQIVTRHFGESLFAARHLFPTRSHLEREGHDFSPEPALSERGKSMGAASASRQGRATATAVVSLADVGSGAGFPGLPIKLWAPNISLTLIESNHKKATFLREVTRALTLTNVNVTTARAQDLPGICFDLVTLRAVERFQEILPVAAGLVATGGRLVLLVGSSQLDQAQMSLPHFSWAGPLPIPLSKSRLLAWGCLR